MGALLIGALLALARESHECGHALLRVRHVPVLASMANRLMRGDSRTRSATHRVALVAPLKLLRCGHEQHAAPITERGAIYHLPTVIVMRSGVGNKRRGL